MLPKLYDKVRNSVVQINVRVPVIDKFIVLNGSPLKTFDTGFGSGFVYDYLGDIVTNAHVVSGVDRIEVTFPNGNSYSGCLLGEDVYSDLAVLHIGPSALQPGGEVLKPLPLANSSSVRVGDQVVAVGNPLGLTASMTQGIVSQTNRTEPDATTGKFYVSDLIQTDATITHGNSGGPLLNLNGQVIGITERGKGLEETPGAALAPGINYAISSATVQKVVPELISHGTYHHSWLGMHAININSDVARQAGLPQTKGVIVVGVTPGSPAEVAGISAGNVSKSISAGIQQFNSDADVVLALDGKPVQNMHEFISYIEGQAPGDTISLKVYKSDGMIRLIPIKLAERPNFGISSALDEAKCRSR